MQKIMESRVMKKAVGLLAYCVTAACFAAPSIVDSVLVFDVAEGETYEYEKTIPDTCTKVVKKGLGTLTMSGNSVDFHGDVEIPTEQKKVGAMLGDYVEVGCNSVLNPGTVIGRNSIVYPTSCARGVIPANSIYKNNGTIIAKR